MNKKEFAEDLRKKLSGLSEKEIEEQLDFYSEMIDDRIEDGSSEEDAVKAVGSVNEISDRIKNDADFLKKAKKKPERRIKVWEIVLLVLGSPIWLSLAIAAFSVIVSLYAVIWSLIASLVAIFASLAASSLGMIIGGVVFAVTGNALSGIAMIGESLFLAGTAIFLFFGCKVSITGCIVMTKKTVLKIVKLFKSKELV
jgi:uncharacterized membrane protein